MLQSSWRTVQLDAICEEEASDDVSLYRLFGFALFAGIRARKNVVSGKLKMSSAKRRKEYAVHLRILQSLVETDKSILPACIRVQDRGRMTFPERSFLPFARNCSREIKKSLNPIKYKQLGHRIIQVNTHIIPL